MERKGIPWNNFVMKKYGVSIKKEIFMAHTPFLRITTALRVAETGALLSKSTDSVQ